MKQMALAVAALIMSAIAVTAEPCPENASASQCMTCAIYHEARGEPFDGQVAVAVVILNRAESSAFPNSICSVVWQDGQFSFTADGASDRMRETQAIARAEIAYETALQLIEDDALEDELGLTEDVMWFHTGGVRPRWSRVFTRVATIGAHRFYEDS